MRANAEPINHLFTQEFYFFEKRLFVVFSLLHCFSFQFDFMRIFILQTIGLTLMLALLGARSVSAQSIDRQVTASGGTEFTNGTGKINHTMKNLIRPLSLFIVCFMAFSLSANAQEPSIQWQKALGGSSSDRAYSIIQTTDGGYALAGYSSSNDGTSITLFNEMGPPITSRITKLTNTELETESDDYRMVSSAIEE